MQNTLLNMFHLLVMHAFVVMLLNYLMKWDACAYLNVRKLGLLTSGPIVELPLYTCACPSTFTARFTRNIASGSIAY